MTVRSPGGMWCPSHSAFGLVQATGNVADAPLLDEPLDDDAALIGRQFINEAKEIDAAIGGVGIRLDAQFP